MLGLRHLVILHPGPGCESLAQQLVLFRSLEILSLNNTYKPEDVSFPGLHLDGLPALHSVKLKRVVPRSIRLREGCELHIVITGRLIP